MAPPAGGFRAKLPDAKPSGAVGEEVEEESEAGWESGIRPGWEA